LLPYLVVTIGLLVIVFPFGPGRDPECTAHIIPTNGLEVLFVGLFYVYAIIEVGIVPIRALTRAYHNENDLPVRLRTFAALLASVVAAILFVTKLSIFSLGYLFPLPPSFITHGTDVTRGLGVALAILWPLGLVSNRFYWTLARPVRFFHKILTLKELEALQARLERLCPPIFPAQLPGWKN